MENLIKIISQSLETPSTLIAFWEYFICFYLQNTGYRMGLSQLIWQCFALFYLASEAANAEGVL